MARKSSYIWAFKPDLRAGAFGWRGSAKVIDQLKSARTEIRTTPRPMLWGKEDRDCPATRGRRADSESPSHADDGVTRVPARLNCA